MPQGQEGWDSRSRARPDPARQIPLALEAQSSHWSDALPSRPRGTSVTPTRQGSRPSSRQRPGAARSVCSKGSLTVLPPRHSAAHPKETRCWRGGRDHRPPRGPPPLLRFHGGALSSPNRPRQSQLRDCVFDVVLTRGDNKAHPAVWRGLRDSEGGAALGPGPGQHYLPVRLHLWVRPYRSSWPL